MKYDYNNRIKPVTKSMASSLTHLQGNKKVERFWIESIADKFYHGNKQRPSDHFISKFKKDVVFWRYHPHPFGIAYFIGTEEEVNNRLLVLSIHDE